MTPQQKLVLVQEIWIRQLGQYMTLEQARDCVAMAELNGLFDLHKIEFAKQESGFQQLQVNQQERCK